MIEKVFISGKIIAETGLHIGGSKTAIDIGGIDLNVIKTAQGVPFIPGSSIKGKLRTILAREAGSSAIHPEKNFSDMYKTDRDFPTIIEIFGDANDKNEKKGTAARLIVRDAFIADKSHFKKVFPELELGYTEIKWENTIDRLTGMANPRQLERVPAGAEFFFTLIYNVFDDGKKEQHLKEIIKAMRILEDDYLGGQGSRGYGQIKFSEVVIEVKTIADYKNDTQRQPETSVTF